MNLKKNLILLKYLLKKDKCYHIVLIGFVFIALVISKDKNIFFFLAYCFYFIFFIVCKTAKNNINEKEFTFFGSDSIKYKKMKKFLNKKDLKIYKIDEDFIINSNSTKEALFSFKDEISDETKITFVSEDCTEDTLELYFIEEIQEIILKLKWKKGV